MTSQFQFKTTALPAKLGLAVPINLTSYANAPLSKIVQISQEMVCNERLVGIKSLHIDTFLPHLSIY